METQTNIRRFQLTEEDSRYLAAMHDIRIARDTELAAIRQEYEPRLSELRASQSAQLDAWRTATYRNTTERNRARASIFRTEDAFELSRLEREMNARLVNCHDRHHSSAGVN